MGQILSEKKNKIVEIKIIHMVILIFHMHVFHQYFGPKLKQMVKNALTCFCRQKQICIDFFCTCDLHLELEI